jgi:hypothetical protein
VSDITNVGYHHEPRFTAAFPLECHPQALVGVWVKYLSVSLEMASRQIAGTHTCQTLGKLQALCVLSIPLTSQLQRRCQGTFPDVAAQVNLSRPSTERARSNPMASRHNHRGFTAASTGCSAIELKHLQQDFLAYLASHITHAHTGQSTHQCKARSKSVHRPCTHHNVYACLVPCAGC